MTNASAKEMIVSGRVTVRPLIKILGKESIKMPTRRVFTAESFPFLQNKIKIDKLPIIILGYGRKSKLNLLHKIKQSTKWQAKTQKPA